MAETFGQFIKRNRLACGLTLQRLSDLSDLSITFISRLEIAHQRFLMWRDPTMTS